MSLADTVALRAAGLLARETALIEAAAGGAGSLLVQLASNIGARVVAGAGGPRKVAVARDLGAGAAVDYTARGWASRVQAEAGAVDGVGGQAGGAALGLLRDGGRFSPTAWPAGRSANSPLTRPPSAASRPSAGRS